MSSIFYGGSDKPDYHVPFHKIRATEGYLRHYDNYLVLNFIAKSTTDVSERRQAHSELTICEQKMNWMQGHPNYEHAEALRGVEALKKRWSRKGEVAD